MIFLYMFIPYVDIFLIFETHKRENIKTFYFNQSLANKVCVLYSEMFDFFCTSPYCAMWLYKFMSHLYLKTPEICQLSEPFSYYFCNRLFGLFHKPFCYLKQIDIHIRRRKGRKKSVGLYQHQTYLILNTLPEKLFLLCF